MARGNFPLNAFNRGRISKLALARTDLAKRVAVSGEVMTNWMPRTLGSMMLRPGLGYIGTSRSNNKAVYLPFIYKTSDTALIEVTDSNVRVWVSDALITRPTVTAAITNGTFVSDLTGWTDVDETGATSQWVSGGYMGLKGTRYSKAIRRQQVTVNETNTKHPLTIVVKRGRPVLKVGTTGGASDYIGETQLRPGVYSFVFTPTGGSFHIEFSANTEYESLVDSVSVAASGVMTIASPWLEADLGKLRITQSADVIFVDCDGYKPRRIERHATESWAVVEYDPEDGPFRSPNTGPTKLTPSALTGNITLSADKPTFDTDHADALFRITSVGQNVSVSVTGNDQWSNSIRVSGVDDTRKFDILITSAGSTVATLRVQRSVGETGSWVNVSGLSWSSTISTTHDDGLDNQIVFYRLGSGSTDWTSSTGIGSLSYAAGGITGIARIGSVVSATESSAMVLTAFGSTTASETWEEGEWSDFRGYPTAVVLHEGRLWHAGRSKIVGSVSDAYESFDPDTEGDSGPINRSIGAGPVDVVEWIAGLNAMIIGGQGAEYQIAASALNEPLTPSNFNIRGVSTQGSAAVQAVIIDKRVLFVQRGNVRLMEIGYSGQSLDYETVDRTLLVPEIGEPTITKIAVQRQPDTRVHCVKSDGTVAVLVSDPAEDVVCWVDVETDGDVEDVVVLPGSVEDAVYYSVKRTINGATVRYLEKFAMESEARGGSTNKIADAFGTFNSSDATTSVTGATHLALATVTAWGSASSGIDLGSTFVVGSTGNFTVGTASTTIYYGLPYTATLKSAKLAYFAQAGTALTQKKKVNYLGVVGADLHARGLQFGPSTANLDYLPVMEAMKRTSTDAVRTAYDHEPIPFEGSWDTDSRVVLLAQAPRPATVLGLIIQVDTKEKV